MNKKQKRESKKTGRSNREEIILHLLRDFPNTQYTLKYLASVSGGASKEGRRETFEILDRLFNEGIVEECAREKYRLSQQHRPLDEGTATAVHPAGAVDVTVDGVEDHISVRAHTAH